MEKQLPAADTNWLNPIAAGALVATSGLAACVSSKFYSLLVPTTTYSLLCATKWWKQWRGRRSKACLQSLLRSVEAFENVIKKHILFFNELARFKVSQVVDDQMFVSTCIQSIRDVILVLYDAIKELESEHAIGAKYEVVYERIENLCQTEYFLAELESFGAKSIKEFLNLFLYVQSQYLMRLGLTVAAGAEDHFLTYNTMNLVPLLDEQTSNCNFNFDIIMFVSNPEKHNFKRLKGAPQVPAQLIRAKSYCMSFVPKLLAVAHQCVRLETHLQRAIENFDETDRERDDFFELVPFMEQVDSELLRCQEEFQRLHITYQKFLNTDDHQVASAIEDSEKEEGEEQAIRIEHDFQKVGESVFGHHDEFFALDGYEETEDKKGQEEKILDEDELINRKITKRNFKPVLLQLKQKIEPLADAMKERQAKVLRQKGIELHDDESLADFELSGGDEDQEPQPFQRKKYNSSEKYNEMRQEMQQKQQFNFLALNLPRPQMMEEEFLE